MAVETDIADQVVAALNGAAFSLPFDAVRAHLPEFDVKQLATLKVSVVPKRMQSTNAARRVMQSDIEIGVVLQKKLNDADLAANDGDELDDLQNLARSIHEFLEQRNMTDGKFVTIAHDPLVDPIALHQHRIYTSVVTPTYRAFRSVS